MLNVKMTTWSQEQEIIISKILIRVSFFTVEIEGNDNRTWRRSDEATQRRRVPKRRPRKSKLNFYHPQKYWHHQLAGKCISVGSKFVSA